MDNSEDLVLYDDYSETERAESPVTAYNQEDDSLELRLKEWLDLMDH